MPEEKDIRTMIDEDIDRVERVWEASSYDSDALEELFRLLLEHYAERIEGFTKRLKVIQPYEDIADMAENYRENVQTLLERMKLFRENGYSNEGLIEYSIAKEREELNFNADFTTVRLEIGMMQGLSLAERGGYHGAFGCHGDHLRAGYAQKGTLGNAQRASGLAFREGCNGSNEDITVVFQNKLMNNRERQSKRKFFCREGAF